MNEKKLAAWEYFVKNSTEPFLTAVIFFAIGALLIECWVVWKALTTAKADAVSEGSLLGWHHGAVIYANVALLLVAVYIGIVDWVAFNELSGTTQNIGTNMQSFWSNCLGQGVLMTAVVWLNNTARSYKTKPFKKISGMLRGVPDTLSSPSPNELRQMLDVIKKNIK